MFWILYHYFQLFSIENSAGYGFLFGVQSVSDVQRRRNNEAASFFATLHKNNKKKHKKCGTL